MVHKNINKKRAPYGVRFFYVKHFKLPLLSYGKNKTAWLFKSGSKSSGQKYFLNRTVKPNRQSEPPK